MMITLENVTKTGGGVIGAKKILSSVNVRIPADQRIALLGGAAQEKRVLINLLAGTAMPESGRIIRRANVSFPAGDLPGFANDLSVRINVAHVARLYGADVRRTIEVVERVVRIGSRFDRAYSELPSTLRKPLAHAVVLSLPFDSYLFPDDRLARDWIRQQTKKGANEPDADISALFAVRMRGAGMIIPTDDVEFARDHCELGLFMNGGELILTRDLTNAVRPQRQPRLRARAALRARLMRRKRRQA